VRAAFIVAASSQAPNKYQVSLELVELSSGMNNLAIPAKSIPQKAMVKMLAQVIPKMRRSPSKSRSATWVVLKL